MLKPVDNSPIKKPMFQGLNNNNKILFGVKKPEHLIFNSWL